MVYLNLLFFTSKILISRLDYYLGEDASTMNLMTGACDVYVGHNESLDYCM